jgi:hypothetical protein
MHHAAQAPRKHTIVNVLLTWTQNNKKHWLQGSLLNCLTLWSQTSLCGTLVITRKTSAYGSKDIQKIPLQHLVSATLVEQLSHLGTLSTDGWTYHEGVYDRHNDNDNYTLEKII